MPPNRLTLSAQVEYDRGHFPQCTPQFGTWVNVQAQLGMSHLAVLEDLGFQYVPLAPACWASRPRLPLRFSVRTYERPRLMPTRSAMPPRSPTFGRVVSGLSD